MRQLSLFCIGSILRVIRVDTTLGRVQSTIPSMKTEESASLLYQICVLTLSTTRSSGCPIQNSFILKEVCDTNGIDWLVFGVKAPPRNLMYPQFINEYGTSRAIYYTDQSDIYMIGMSWSNHITHFIEFYNHLLHILHYPQDYPLVRSLFCGDFIDENLSESFLFPFNRTWVE